MEASEFEEKAKSVLIRLGLGHWTVYWLSDASFPVRGKVVAETLMIEIYDIDEDDAWATFVHEVVEIKLRSLLRTYRILVNKLIEGYQELADGEKDRFIEGLPEVFEVARDSSPSS